MKYLYMGGWSYPAQLPLTNCIFLDWWLKEEEIKARILREKEVGLIGWSLGAYKLFPFMSMPNVQEGFFFSLSRSFIEGSENPYGWSKKILARMKKRLISNKSTVVQDFQEKTGVVMGVNASVEQLVQGIEELGKIRLEPYLENKKLWMFSGCQDLIVPWQSTLLFATECCANLIQFENAGHATPFDEGISVLKKFMQHG